MDKKRSLYEVLGVQAHAEVAEIRGAFTQQLAGLENSAATLDAAELASAKQMLRIAAGTLLDSSSRLAYDAKLMETRRLSELQGGSASPMPPMGGSGNFALSLEPMAPGAGDSVKLRADALALRAESLSLRADAMLLQAGQRSLARAAADDGAVASSAWISVLSSGPLLRVLMFLIVLAAVAFGVSRCAANAPMATNPTNAANTQAMERAALQEYFQSHGVRPANMAELERLETERRRRDNEQRNTKQDSEKLKSDEKAFEEDARRRAERVSERLRADEERQQESARREQLELERDTSQRKEAERRAEEQRIKTLEDQWRRTLERK